MFLTETSRGFQLDNRPARKKRLEVGERKRRRNGLVQYALGEDSGLGAQRGHSCCTGLDVPANPIQGNVEREFNRPLAFCGKLKGAAQARGSVSPSPDSVPGLAIRPPIRSPRPRIVSKYEPSRNEAVTHLNQADSRSFGGLGGSLEATVAP